MVFPRRALPGFSKALTALSPISKFFLVFHPSPQDRSDFPFRRTPCSPSFQDHGDALHDSLFRMFSFSWAFFVSVLAGLPRCKAPVMMSIHAFISFSPFCRQKIFFLFCDPPNLDLLNPLVLRQSYGGFTSLIRRIIFSTPPLSRVPPPLVLIDASAAPLRR